MSSIYDYLPGPEPLSAPLRRRAPRVLVVDDQPINVKLLERKLEREGMVPLLAENGRQCIEIARAEQPDLILLDVMMPEMDGIEACRLLHSSPQTREIPIIFITARSGKEGKLEGLAAGAVDYVVKPIDLDETMARVRTHLQMREYHRENLALQQRLSEARRQALLGQLTLGLSHNLNNLLGIVIGYLDLMRTAPDNRALVERSMSGMDKGLRRIAGVISQVLKLGARERPNLRKTGVADLIADVMAQARAQCDGFGDVTLEVTDAGGFRFDTDPALLAPALVNLLVNAQESVGRVSGLDARIVFSADVVDAPTSRHVRFRVRDNGPGVDGTVADAIFQPFISVKSEVGAGFGLPLARHAVEQLGGTLTLENLAGGGALATVTLPCPDPAAPDRG